MNLPFLSAVKNKVLFALALMPLCLAPLEVLERYFKIRSDRRSAGVEEKVVIKKEKKKTEKE